MPRQSVEQHLVFCGVVESIALRCLPFAVRRAVESGGSPGVARDAAGTKPTGAADQRGSVGRIAGVVDKASAASGSRPDAGPVRAVSRFPGGNRPSLVQERHDPLFSRLRVLLCRRGRIWLHFGPHLRRAERTAQRRAPAVAAARSLPGRPTWLGAVGPGVLRCRRQRSREPSRGPPIGRDKTRPSHGA